METKGSILGMAVRRREDPRLITGHGKFVADMPAEGALHALFVRSPVAHARIKNIDATAARALARALGRGAEDAHHRYPNPPQRFQVNRADEAGSNERRCRFRHRLPLYPPDTNVSDVDSF